MEGVIDPGTDVDYFEFTLTSKTGMFIWTTGDLDTVGELQSSSGMVIDSDDDDPSSDAPLNFFMHQTLAAGTYRIKVSSYGEATGSYVLRTETMVDAVWFSDAQEIILDSDGNGTVNGIIDPEREGDYFKFELEGDPNGTSEIVIYATGLVGDTYGQLFSVIFDPARTFVYEGPANDDGYLLPGRKQFLLRATRYHDQIHYLRVSGYSSLVTQSRKGWYTLHVNTVTEPGDTTATATPLDLGIAAGGRIDPSTDEDYFRLDLTEATNIVVSVVSEKVNIDGELLDADGNLETNLSKIPLSGYGPWPSFLDDRLEAGTYYIKVTRSDDVATEPFAGGADTGPYTIRVVENRDRCQNTDTPTTINDPLYGCQWHLHNTRQPKQEPSGEDINVEEVWEADTLGAGINVAVVDDGMDYTHEDLSDNVVTARNHDYETRGTDTTDIFRHFLDHGTAIAGLIAARDNDLGVRGWRPERRSTATTSSGTPPMETQPTPRNAACCTRISPITVGGLPTGPDWPRLPASGRWRSAKESRKVLAARVSPISGPAGTGPCREATPTSTGTPTTTASLRSAR